MKKLSVLLMLVAGMLVAGALPAGADPTNGHSAMEFDLDCGPDGVITVLNQIETGTWTLFGSAAEGSHGRQYVAASTNERFYVGELTEEPDLSEAVGLSEKTWGKRKGYDITLECSVVATLTFEEGTFTAFIDATLVSKGD